MALTMTARPFSLPRALMIASFRPVSLLRDLQPRAVRFKIDEFQRVGRNQIRIENFVLVVIKKLSQAGSRVNPEMLVAFRADVVILFQVLFPDDLPAAVALDPQPFGPDGLFARSIQLTGFALEPCHKSSSQQSVLSIAAK